MTANFKEQEPWDENAIQIEDLGAPENRFSLLLFSFGKKWHAAVRLRTIPAAFVYTICLVALFFLPGSTLLSPGPVARTPRAATFIHQQTYECVALNVNATAIVWQRSSSVPTPSGASVHTMPMCNIVIPRGVGKP